MYQRFYWTCEYRWVRERVIEWMTQWDCALYAGVCIRECWMLFQSLWIVAMHTMSMYGINLYTSRPLSHSFFPLEFGPRVWMDSLERWARTKAKGKKEQVFSFGKTKRFTFRVKILNKKNFHFACSVKLKRKEFRRHLNVNESRPIMNHALQSRSCPFYRKIPCASTSLFGGKSIIMQDN